MKKKKTKQSLMALKNDGWSYFELVEYKENVITLTHVIASGKKCDICIEKKRQT